MGEKYLIDKLNEFIEFCKVKPRDIKPTEKSVYRYANNKLTLLQFMPEKRYGEFLRQAANVAIENIFMDVNLINFLQYTYIFNIGSTDPYFILIDVLEELKRRFTEDKVKTLIFKITCGYVNYLESIDINHKDLDRIYKIRTDNRMDYENAIGEIANEIGVDIETVFSNLMEIPTRIMSEDVSEQVNNLDCWLSGIAPEISKEFKKVPVVHGVLTSEFYYIARDIIYRSGEYSSEFIERMISGMDELVEYYKENFDDYSIFSYNRFGTMISGRHALKLRYNLDNHLWDTEDLLKDYTDDIIFIHNKGIHAISVGTTVKLLEEMYKLQALYNEHGMEIDMFKQYKEVFVLHTALFRNGLIINVEGEDMQTYMIENSVPGIGAGIFFGNTNTNFRMFDSTIADYFNIFNDKVMNRNHKYRTIDLGYVYRLKEENEIH